VTLLLTVRSFTDPVRQRLLAAIERIAKAEAAAAGAPREPRIEHVEGTYALVNDAELTRRVSAALTRELGAERTKETPPEMASEDFSEFQRAGVPVLMLRVGAVEKSSLAISGGVSLVRSAPSSRVNAADTR